MKLQVWDTAGQERFRSMVIRHVTIAIVTSNGTVKPV